MARERGVAVRCNRTRQTGDSTEGQLKDVWETVERRLKLDWGPGAPKKWKRYVPDSALTQSMSKAHISRLPMDKESLDVR